MSNQKVYRDQVCFMLKGANSFHFKQGCVNYLFEIVEVLIHPMFENIENSELNGLAVLLSKSFHVLGDLNLRLFVAELGIRLGVA